MSDDQHRVVVVTGGTSGVGLRTAMGLARSGTDVVIVGRSAERGAAAAERCAGLPGLVGFRQADAADADRMSEILDEAAVDRMLTGLVCAGSQPAIGPRRFSESTIDEIRRELDSQLLPRIVPVRAALSFLVDGAAIVMLTTDAARTATRGEAVIGAAGAALIMLVKGLAQELGERRIRVNGISMTLTSDTGAWDRVFDPEGGDEGTRDMFSRALARFPFGAAPTADDVADAVLFLLGAASVTGQVLSVNGGLSFGGW